MRDVYITDHHVARLWKERLKDPLFVFPAGEASKTREMKERIEDWMISLGCSRGTRIVAVGGGVVLDLAGFVAATYARGIEWTAVPTTLLAMVDASIGGKVGVNALGLKNMIGAFHLPASVEIDLRFLETLPKEEMQNGLAEILKYGFIADPSLLKEEGLEKRIGRSREIKEEIVAKDLYDRGVRASLNFGHTVGHAIETLSEYAISHGLAVAKGMALEATISHLAGYLSRDETELVQRTLREAGFDLDISFAPEALMKVIHLDKKGGMTLLSKIGKVDSELLPLSVEQLSQALKMAEVFKAAYDHC